MKFSSFWNILSKGGTSTEGINYCLIKENLLNISAPNNKNKNYNIKRDKAEEYFNILENSVMTHPEFRLKRSAYFLNIYLYIIAGKT